jgi:hypothetical protein
MVYDDDDVPDLVQGPIYDSDDEDDEVALPALSDDDDMRQHYHEDETPPPLRRSTRERLPRDPAYVYATISRPIRRKPLSFLRNCTIAERRTAYANNLVHFILAADTPDADKDNTPDAAITQELVAAMEETMVMWHHKCSQHSE